jgi:hypothetical protein
LRLELTDTSSRAKATPLEAPPFLESVRFLWDCNNGSNAFETIIIRVVPFKLSFFGNFNGVNRSIFAAFEFIRGITASLWE